MLKADDDKQWTFFSNHGHVYFLLAMNDDITVREIAIKVGITERTVLGIIQDFEESGYIRKKKIGRNNRYTLVAKKTLRHPLESHIQVKDIVKVVNRKS